MTGVGTLPRRPRASVPAPAPTPGGPPTRAAPLPSDAGGGPGPPVRGARTGGRYRDLPIQRKLFLAFVLLDLLVLLAVGLFFPTRELRELQLGREKLATQGKAVAELVGNTVAPALDFGDAATVRAVLKSTTDRMPQVRQILVAGSTQAPERAGPSRDVPPPSVSGAGEGQVVVDGSSIWLRRRLSGEAERYLVLQLSQADLRARFLWSVWFAGGLSLAFLLVGGLLAQVLSRGIVRPITDVVETVAAVGREGSWDLTQRVREHGADEPGRLATWINRFLAESGELIGSVKKVAHEVIGGSTEMKGALEGLSQAANALNDAIAQVANTAEQSVGRMRQNLKLAEDSSQLATRVRQNAESAGAAAARVAESSREGHEVAEKARMQMSQISERTAETRRIMESLLAHSGRIDAVLDALRAIAQQTNLLALNAAIEAARAGDHGRGFAVVADEVRKLADQAAGYAGEIGGSIGAIRGDIQTAVSAVAKVDAEVEGGASVIASNAQLLDSVAAQVERVAAEVGTIVQLTVEQQSALGRVTESAVALAQLGDEQAASAAEMSATVQEQTASTNELSAGADQLHTVVTQLQQQIDRIRF